MAGASLEGVFVGERAKLAGHGSGLLATRDEGSVPRVLLLRFCFLLVYNLCIFA